MWGGMAIRTQLRTASLEGAWTGAAARMARVESRRKRQVIRRGAVAKASAFRAISRRAVTAALILAFSAGLMATGVVSALTYDGTNPASTPCGDGSHAIYTLGWRTAANPTGTQGIPTPIYYNGTKIGTVEIRHSAYCATVWSRVTNLTSSSRQVHETIVLYSDSNGNGRTEHQYPTTDTVVAGGTGYSNQYRDRASFSAKGGIYYAGAWRWAETGRTVAWDQYTNVYPNTPFACNHAGYPCQRWPTLPSGLSATYHYNNDASIQSMPNGSGGTVDVTGDVNFMFSKFNAVAASNPFFYTSGYPQADVFVYSYFEAGIVARAAGYAGSDNYYWWGEVKLSTGVGWGSSSNNRAALCHEFDHLMGLGHVEWADSNGVTNVGSKATCIGASISTGPSIDDVSALNAVYGGSVP